MGGESVTPLDIEWRLKNLKIVESDLEQDPRLKTPKNDSDDESQPKFSGNNAKGYLRRDVGADEHYDLN